MLPNHFKDIYLIMNSGFEAEQQPLEGESKMKRLIPIAVAVFLLSLPVSVFAGGYGAAGCGLGSIVFGSEPGAQQIFASTTNGTSGSQTFGITTGTSNCGDNGLVSMGKEREVFAQQNYTSLVKEMAQGEGESLYALASLYKCPIEAHKEFGAMVQKKFHHLVIDDETTPTEMLILLEGELVRHPRLSNSCENALN